MKKLKEMMRVLCTHPVKGSRLRAWWRFLTWQLVEKHVAKNGRVKRWLGNRRLLVIPGRYASTGNYYFGLLEYPEMSFLLEYATKNDVFVDCGANIGVYSILLAPLCKRGYAFEPSRATFDILQKNMELNKINNVKLVNSGVGEKNEVVRFSVGQDCENHVVQDGIKEGEGMTEEVMIVSLDEYLKEDSEISILKIDVEGMEEEVLAGGGRLLDSPSLNIILMEIFGNEERVEKLKKKGFKLYGYDVDKHMLKEVNDYTFGGDNGIFIRNVKKLSTN